MMSVCNQSGDYDNDENGDTSEETACFYGMSTTGGQSLHGSPK